MTRTGASADGLLALLAAQRKALLAGDLSALDGAADRLEQAMRGLAQGQVTGATLGALRSAAAHNARLVAAAQTGVATARARLAPDAGQSLTTYDAAGGRRSGAAVGQILSRRLGR